MLLPHNHALPPPTCLSLSRMIKLRGLTSGVDEFEFPDPSHLLLHRDILLNYLTNVNKVQVELARLLQKIAINNTVIVSTVNKGQSELLINFVCSARSRGLDISNLIVFPTDLHSKVLAESMGLATFYSQEVTIVFLYQFGLLHSNLTNLPFILTQLMQSIPSNEAARYGDRDFALISEIRL